MNYLSLKSVCQQISKKPSAAQNIFMPRAVRYLKGISPSAKLVMEEIVDRYNDSDERNCNLSEGQFAEFLDLSESTVVRAIKQLEKKNLISVERAEQWFDKQANVYTINWEILLDPKSYSQKRRQRGLSQGSQNDTHQAVKMTPIGSQNEIHGCQNDIHRQSKRHPSGSQNDRRTIEATSQSTSESNQPNEQLIIDCAKHGSALDVDLASDPDVIALRAALDALVVTNPTPSNTNGDEPTPDLEVMEVISLLQRIKRHPPRL
jgi:predicted transcriptional regulator